MENVDIARIFEEVADLLEIQDESPFRVRAYRTAARTLAALGEPVAGIVEREGAGALTALPGIGKDLAGKIVELLETGELPLLKQLAAKTPESLVEMMRIPSLGPKRARLLYERLGIETADELEQAARSGRLLAVRGFGEKLAATILDGCVKRRATAGRVRLADAEAQVAPLLKHLRAARGALAVEVAGSLRRRKETVGDVDILVSARQGEPVDRLRRTIGGIAILHGAEVDILEDGSLDLDDAALAALDYVVASVHAKLTMPEPAMTRRVLRALESPFVTALGHPTGRLLGKREPYALDVARIARAARELGVLLEINAQPERLDLCDVHIRLAREAGAKLVVATDAHAVGELDFMRHGIDQARRGWCAAADIANTAPRAELLELIGRRRRDGPLSSAG
ncbi:helix-hairpin-helix domain-containing protein [Sorangium sp. So ce327]|uniref:helix-hairpin-helix domain-containing protein n=1 Tax=Sorangium sp. So ce327 TaxID=3133301 RepID=UPI003F622B41